jgi:AraC-like DNA-binding protein
MTVVALVHRAPAVRAALRRGLARRSSGPRLMSLRSVERASAVLRRELVDAVVVDVRSGMSEAVLRLIGLYPGIPVFGLSPFSPEDGPVILACRRAGMRGLLVEGVDGASGGEWIAARTASRRRTMVLRDAPALLRLTEPVQVRIWEEILRRGGTRSRTSDLAVAMGVTREHLSREFAAGGAPNLKRVIDLVRICWAADLLANPGYDVSTVSRVLRYASPSHLAHASRRISGLTPVELPRIGPRQVFLRFLKGRTRSRL